MPFICESITNHPLYKKSGTVLIPTFIKIKPLSCFAPLKSKLRSCYMPATYRDSANDIHDFDTGKDDVWIIGFPECGLSYMKQIVWLILNNFNFEKLRSDDKYLDENIPLLEHSTLMAKPIVKLNTIIQSKRLQQPRIITSHLPVPLLPKKIWKNKPKIIYMTRNPQHLIFNYYQHYCLTLGYLGTFDEFQELFTSDFIAFGPFHEHVIEFWEMNAEEYILIVKHEEFEENQQLVIDKVIEFLGVDVDNSNRIELTKFMTDQLVEQKNNKICSSEYQSEFYLSKFQKMKEEKFQPKTDVTNETIRSQLRLDDKLYSWSAKQLENCDFTFNHV